ncbi:hypothetical protein Tco_0153034 [Tanacetum coccineum]
MCKPWARSGILAHACLGKREKRILELYTNEEGAKVAHVACALILKGENRSPTQGSFESGRARSGVDVRMQRGFLDPGRGGTIKRKKRIETWKVIEPSVVVDDESPDHLGDSSK